MNARKRMYVMGFFLFALLAGLMAYSGFTRAQASVPAHTQTAQTIAPGAIPVQGRLTDANGVALNGVYTTTFRLYDAADAVIAICADERPVTVVNGLFSDYIDHCYDDIVGQKLWLGVQVLSDAEMLPRQVILTVPYALSLVPGAVISHSSGTILTLHSTDSNGEGLQTDVTGTTGKALEAISKAGSGENYGVYATNNSPAGYAGYFYNGSSGTGVWAMSLAGTALQANSLGTAIRATSGTGAALAAEGTGRITSTAKSYVWISGNGVHTYSMSDTTRIDLDSIGGAKVYRNGGSGTRNVMLPITIMGPLYGQDVRITALDIYWAGDTEFDGITAVLLRRQTGVCPTCYASIIFDNPIVGLTCEDAANLTGCTRHYDTTTNNVLTSGSGVLYLTLEMTFNSNTSWIEIGGVRLTLEHK
jgi:hypothetical protein